MRLRWAVKASRERRAVSNCRRSSLLNARTKRGGCIKHSLSHKNSVAHALEATHFELPLAATAGGCLVVCNFPGVGPSELASPLVEARTLGKSITWLHRG